MGPYIKGRSRPILVAFERQSDRDLLYAKRMELRRTANYQRVWVNEDLGLASKRKRGIIRLIAREAALQGIDCKSGKYSVPGRPLPTFFLLFPIFFQIFLFIPIFAPKFLFFPIFSLIWNKKYIFSGLFIFDARCYCRKIVGPLWGHQFYIGILYI